MKAQDGKLAVRLHGRPRDVTQRAMVCRFKGGISALDLRAVAHNGLRDTDTPSTHAVAACTEGAATLPNSVPLVLCLNTSLGAILAAGQPSQRK